MFGVFFVTSAFGAVINAVERTNWGYLANISYLVGSIWSQLFEGSNKTTNGAIFFRSPIGSEVPLWCCWFGVGVICLICLYMLARKIRGAEVVR